MNRKSSRREDLTCRCAVPSVGGINPGMSNARNLGNLKIERSVFGKDSMNLTIDRHPECFHVPLYIMIIGGGNYFSLKGKLYDENRVDSPHVKKA